MPRQKIDSSLTGHIECTRQPAFVKKYVQIQMTEFWVYKNNQMERLIAIYQNKIQNFEAYARYKTWEHTCGQGSSEGAAVKNFLSSATTTVKYVRSQW